MRSFFSVVASCVALTAGVVLPAAPASAGTARTVACRFVPVDDGAVTAPAPVDRFRTPTAVPASAVAFTSPDGFGGRRYFLGPANGTCVAHGGMDQDFAQRITLPGQRSPAFEQVFGAGGDHQLRYGCRYLPTLRPYADPDECAPPPRSTEHVELVDTGMATLPAALVRVDRKASDPQLKTSGTDPVVGVVLAFDLGGDPDDPTYRAVTTSFADCRLTPATAGICLASLRAFVDEAITFQRRYVDFRPTGDPGAKIRTAMATAWPADGLV